MTKPQQNEIAVSVILHDVLPEHRDDYERWLLDAKAAHQRFPGYLGTDIIRPVESGSRYVVILRFVDKDRAHAWLLSPVRQDLLKIATPWLADDDRFHVHHDAEFWFKPPTGRRQPKRWKQWMLSALAVFPLTVLLPKPIRYITGWATPWLPDIGVAALTAFVISGLMVYLLMPSLIRVAGSWLMK
jgi:antibiotic biosynthesis monooxygenase (ABM) superfamily enzyme